jgi:hypothetical protein
VHNLRTHRLPPRHHVNPGCKMGKIINVKIPLDQISRLSQMMGSLVNSKLSFALPGLEWIEWVAGERDTRISGCA